jgi:hypothetical protein
MSSTSNPRERTEIVIRPDHATVFVSLELSRSRWPCDRVAAKCASLNGRGGPADPDLFVAGAGRYTRPRMVGRGRCIESRGRHGIGC